MGLINFTANFKPTDIARMVALKRERLEAVLVDQFKQVGEQAVTYCRDLRTYKDRTSNLRGSIAFAIIKDGAEVFGSYEGTEEGQTEARRLMSLVGDKITEGYGLILVAGMSYAAAVESNGYDVITGGSIEGGALLKAAFTKVQDRLNRLARK